MSLEVQTRRRLCRAGRLARDSIHLSCGQGSHRCALTRRRVGRPPGAAFGRLYGVAHPPRRRASPSATAGALSAQINRLAPRRATNHPRLPPARGRDGKEDGPSKRKDASQTPPRADVAPLARTVWGLARLRWVARALSDVAARGRIGKA